MYGLLLSVFVAQCADKSIIVENIYSDISQPYLTSAEQPQLRNAAASGNFGVECNVNQQQTAPSVGTPLPKKQRLWEHGVIRTKTEMECGLVHLSFVPSIFTLFILLI